MSKLFYTLFTCFFILGCNSNSKSLYSKISFINNKEYKDLTYEEISTVKKEIKNILSNDSLDVFRNEIYQCLISTGTSFCTSDYYVLWLGSKSFENYNPCNDKDIEILILLCKKYKSINNLKCSDELRKEFKSVLYEFILLEFDNECINTTKNTEDEFIDRILSNSENLFYDYSKLKIGIDNRK